MDTALFATKSDLMNKLAVSTSVEIPVKTKVCRCSLMKKVISILFVAIVLFGVFFVYTVHDKYEKGYTTGYLVGAADGAGSGYNIRDPTYAEMMVFIEADQTDKKVYDADTYNCYDYTKDFCDNAAAHGYRTGFVYIYFKESAHALVCFNTADKGLIFIEPQYDAIVNVAVGINYWDVVEGVKSPFDDTIVRFGVIW
ncbi:MAG: hypothetical protein FWH37_05185 [Candidatus Bathyarchaeota archaeon]|nr:hypothetical protein [Candidatus Termiticorpusculum sp.]